MIRKVYLFNQSITHLYNNNTHHNNYTSRFATVSLKNQSINDTKIVYEDVDILKHLPLNNKLNQSTHSNKLVCSLLQQSYQHPS